MAESVHSSSWYRIAQARPRLRAQGEIRPHWYSGRPWYVLQDKATGRVHRYTPATQLILSRMDGTRTIDQIWNDVVGQLGEDAPTQDDVIRLLSQLHVADLLALDGTPETGELLDRATKHRRRSIIAFVKNPMSAKVPLFDPNALIGLVARAVGWIPGWLAILGWLAIVVPVAVTVPLYWSELTNNFSDQVLSSQNLVLMALLYPMIKVLHEIGHGVFTRLFGGEVRETGIMFLVFYPVPYVDASASLVFPSKYHRALVGAGGVIVELVLASAAFYIWLAAEPGIVRAAAFNVMLIAGASSLLVNGNPLLRFDAYYVLTDLIEVPNLGTRSNRYWGYLFDRYAFGARERTFDLEARERFWLVVYGPLAFVYRITVLLGIALFVATKYLAVGVALAVWSLITGIVMPLAKIVKHVAAAPGLRRHRTRTLLVSITTVGAAAVVLFVAPVPQRVVAEGVVWVPESAHIRAGADGFLAAIIAPPGAGVRAGNELARLEDPLLAASILVQEAKAAELEVQFRSELLLDRVAAAITEVALAAAEAELTALLEKADSLIARSPIDGVFVLPSPVDLPGRYFREGELLGYVLPDAERSVRSVLHQADIDRVRSDLIGVEARLAERPGERFEAIVTREVPAAQNESPSIVLTAAGGGLLATDPRDPEGLQTLERIFQLDLRLVPDPGEPFYGGRVHLIFELPWEPIGIQLYRELRLTFLSLFNA